MIFFHSNEPNTTPSSSSSSSSSSTSSSTSSSSSSSSTSSDESPSLFSFISALLPSMSSNSNATSNERVNSASNSLNANLRKRAQNRSIWDYRYGEGHLTSTLRKKFSGKVVDTADRSLMTYRSHKVFHTLIRSYFSPKETTGQKYIYTGSYDGSIYIYDILTGKVVKRLDGHHATVRDVSWHPFLPIIMSTSWDGTVQRWDYDFDLDLFGNQPNKKVKRKPN